MSSCYRNCSIKVKNLILLITLPMIDYQWVDMDSSDTLSANKILIQFCSLHYHKLPYNCIQGRICHQVYNSEWLINLKNCICVFKDFCTVVSFTLNYLCVIFIINHLFSYISCSILLGVICRLFIYTGGFWSDINNIIIWNKCLILRCLWKWWDYLLNLFTIIYS